MKYHGPHLPDWPLGISAATDQGAMKLKGLLGFDALKEMESVFASLHQDTK